MINKLFAIFILLLAFEKAFAINCRTGNIKEGYYYAATIFYGKYISTDTIHQFFDLSGRPFVVDNFEVIRYYKGIPANYIKKTNRVSLINDCGDGGICYKKGKNYLVYTFFNFDCGGHISSHGCTRTREIINNNFVVSDALYKEDYGKDENIMLQHLASVDTSDIYSERFNSFEKKLKHELAESQAQLGRMQMMFYSSLTLLAVGVSVILVRSLKQKQRTR